MKTVGLILAGVIALILGWLVYQQSYTQRMLRHLQQCLRYDSSRYDLSFETAEAMYRAERRLARERARVDPERKQA